MNILELIIQNHPLCQSQFCYSSAKDVVPVNNLGKTVRDLGQVSYQLAALMGDKQ